MSPSANMQCAGHFSGFTEHNVLDKVKYTEDKVRHWPQERSFYIL